MLKQIYLDYASATPLDPTVLKAMTPYFADNFYNPSALYGSAVQVKNDINRAKQLIAQHLGVQRAEIIMTSGGTESNNLAISGVMDFYPDKKVLISKIEHESVLAPAEKYNCSYLKVDENGLLDIEQFSKISDEVVLITVMLANNEIGTIQQINKISEKIKEVRRDRQARNVDVPLYFHTDACQAPSFLDIHAHRLGVDMMTLNGGKIYGPKQTGVLYVKSGVNLKPRILGGGQQRNIRSGTENPAGIIGFSVALDIAVKLRNKETIRLTELQKRLIDGLLTINPKITITGSLKRRLPNNVHVLIPGADNERLLFQLDEAGVQAAAGSACSASNDEPSHVLKAIGINDEEARSSIRFTMGRGVEEKDIDYTLKIIKNFII